MLLVLSNGGLIESVGKEVSALLICSYSEWDYR